MKRGRITSLATSHLC